MADFEKFLGPLVVFSLLGLVIYPNQNVKLLVLFFLVSVAIYFILKRNNTDEYVNMENVVPGKLEYDTSMYQYSNPSLPKERNYYMCISEECGGNTQNYDCLEKCKLKTFRAGMDTMDTKDWVCFPFAEDEDAYYKCLSQVYADYRYP